MNSRQRQIVIIATICAIAISVAAATLDSTVELSPGSGGSGDKPAQSSQPNMERPEEPVASVGPPCVAWLATPWVALGLLMALGGGTALLYRHYTRFEAATVMTALGIPGLGLYLLLTACETSEARQRLLRRLSKVPGYLPADDTGSGSDPVVPAILLGAVLLVGLLIATIFLSFSLSGGGGDSSIGSKEEDGNGAAAAHAAGEAADRIKGGGDLSTEIHQAWRDMATHLEVDRPDTSTPGEFASAAIESGLDPDAVLELTTLFEEVRYGGFEATADREARAQQALQRIKVRYETVTESAGEITEGNVTDE